MSKDKTVQVLEHKIAELDKKITNFQKYQINEKKTENLKILKLKYETDLEEWQNKLKITRHNKLKITQHSKLKFIKKSVAYDYRFFILNNCRQNHNPYQNLIHTWLNF